MFLYVVGNTNFGHKIGITDDLIKRKKQYTTIFPGVDFLFSIYSSHGWQIEESFKSRFSYYRKIFDSGRKSEVYDLYWQYICEQIIRCFHSLSEAIVLNDTDHSSIEYYSNPDTGITNYYLSKHYFYKKFKQPYKYTTNYGIENSIYVGSTLPFLAKERKEKDLDDNRYILRHVNFKGLTDKLSKIKNLEELNYFEKLENNDQFITEFGKMSEISFENYYNSVDYLRREVFKVLTNSKIIVRPYDLQKLGTYDEKGSLRIHSSLYGANNYAENIFYGKRFGHRHQSYSYNGRKGSRIFSLGYKDEGKKIRKEKFISRTMNKTLTD